MRKRVLSLIGVLILTSLMVMTTESKSQASSEETKKVDGSYLTQEETAEGKSHMDTSRGEYIMLGECSITKAGRGRIYVYSSTTAGKTVNLVSTVAYVDEYNEKDDSWGQIAFWRKDEKNTYFVLTSNYLSVDSGKYYRVRADHFAGMESPYESTYSFTDGILVN